MDALRVLPDTQAWTIARPVRQACLERDVIGAVLAMTLAVAFPTPAKLSVNVEIGGLLSGPSRRYVDLDRGILFVGVTPRGRRPGDAAGVSTKALRVAETRPLSAQDLGKLRALAAAVLRAGAEGPPTCAPTADRIIRLDVSGDGRAIEGTLFCPTPEAMALVDAVFDLGGASD
jgi:hypothetical protein